MSALKPGLYRATVRGVPGDCTVMVGDDGNSTFALDIAGNVRRCYVFTDARPLIVLDLSDAPMEYTSGTPAVISWLRMSADGEHGAGRRDLLLWLAGQIEEQTKPARISQPEPGKHVTARVAPIACVHPDEPETFLHLRLQKMRNEDPYDWVCPVSYTHLTLPTKA